jgi:5'-nucleotidase / UDP-sugar diphosphatase
MFRAIKVFRHAFFSRTTVVELDSRAATVRTRDAAIGELIADGMRWSAQIEVAVTNGGSIRGEKIYPPGTRIALREVLAELSFGNRLVTIDVRGSALKAAIENGLSRLPAPSGRFLQVAASRWRPTPPAPLATALVLLWDRYWRSDALILMQNSKIFETC